MHEKLLKKLETEKQWAEVSLFEHHTVAERPDLLMTMCERAMAKHDEPGALRLHPLLDLAIEDFHDKARDDEARKSDQAASERRRFHEEAAKSAQARAAVELWRKTPIHREGRWHDRETYESGKSEEPTLLKFKQALLERVVRRWRETVDEIEAETLFSALIEAAIRRDPGFGDLLPEAFRASEDHHAHRQRTVRHLLRFIDRTRVVGDSDAKDPAPTIWIGMMRKFERREMVALGTILRHLPLSVLGVSHGREIDSAPLIDAVARDTEDYAKMHAVMRELSGAIEAPRSSIHAFRPSYPRRGQVELTIVASPSYPAKGQEENAFHELAHALRDRIREWLKARELEKGDAPLLKLTIRWPPAMHADEGAPPRYQRTFELG